MVQKETVLAANETDAGVAEVLELPLLPVRNTVLVPNTVTHLFVGRETTIKAIEYAMARDKIMVAVSQKTEEIDDPIPDDLYSIGVEVHIERMLKMPDGTTSLVLQGKRRLRVNEFTQQAPFLKVRVTSIREESDQNPVQEALVRAVLALFEKCIKLGNGRFSEESYITAMNALEASHLADFITSLLDLPVARRQEILEIFPVVERLQKVSILLSKELDLLELESQIHDQVQQEVDKSQREYFLREHLKAIQKELGEGDPTTQENLELREKIVRCGMPIEVASRANKELDRLMGLPLLTPEGGIVRTYLDWLVTLPWSEKTEDRLNITEAARILERNHYGLSKVKERILEYMAVRKLSSSMRSPILCFVGPPGVGKTSLGRSIAEALGRKFVRLSLGGIRDEAEIRGHRRTYIGALPGRVIQTMRTAGMVNPLFMLDEIDKVGADFRGDPSAALLEVLDPEQNMAFSDHYLEVPYDLSRVIFVTTANLLDPVPPALRDRMEVIELPGYTEVEKLHIGQQFLFPRQLQEHGLQGQSLRFSSGTLQRVIREYTYEAGVRNLEREIGTLLRKLARRVAEEKRIPKRITPAMVPHYLGPQKHVIGVAEEQDEVGIATGLAWNAGGGDLITVEVILVDGKGHLTLTGQLGEVMKESAQAALSYARSRSKLLGIKPKSFEKTDIHIHLPAGATPKDGPSAGITMATALLSALTQRTVRREVAMTGEITLRGRVLPVGGIKEKVLAAHRAGITTLILPRKNHKDLSDVPAEVLRQLTLVEVGTMDEVLAVALQSVPPPVKRKTFAPLVKARR